MNTAEEVTKFAAERGMSIRTAYRRLKQMREREESEACMMQAEAEKNVDAQIKEIENDGYKYSKGEWV